MVGLGTVKGHMEIAETVVKVTVEILEKLQANFYLLEVIWGHCEDEARALAEHKGSLL